MALSNSVQKFPSEVNQGRTFFKYLNPTQNLCVYIFFSRILSLEYWFDGPIGFSLACIGLVFNAIAIYTLSKQVCHKTFHSLMMLLSCWDFGLLFFSQFLFALPELSEWYKNGLFLQLVPYMIPMAQICLSGSCFTTVALTVER